MHLKTDAAGLSLNICPNHPFSQSFLSIKFICTSLAHHDIINSIKYGIFLKPRVFFCNAIHINIWKMGNRRHTLGISSLACHPFKHRKELLKKFVQSKNCTKLCQVKNKISLLVTFDNPLKKEHTLFT